jgi:hypothetical protein
MTFILGILVPVLTYGVLCALLGIWVEREFRPYRAQWSQDAQNAVQGSLARLKGILGRLNHTPAP